MDSLNRMASLHTASRNHTLLNSSSLNTLPRQRLP